MLKTFLPQQDRIKRLHHNISCALSKDFFQSRCIGHGGHDDYRDLTEVFLHFPKHC